ncbi:MAG TPA: cupredoxin domain-containing protein [Patescibacteria group bacterium]|nr:cupredoxin domain-containing protein [Patescibacteria group bacterium]
MNKKVLITVVVVLAAAGVTAYVLMNKKNNQTPTTSTSDTNMTDTNMQNSNSSNASNTGEAQATDKVEIKDFAFSPGTITVKKGTTVTWTNNDSTPHTVTADSGTGPDSGSLSKGQTYTFKYDTVGTFSYHCSFHSNMTAKVIVTE